MKERVAVMKIIMPPEARAREISYRKNLFDKKIDFGSENDCWIWKAAVNQCGIGMFNFAGVLAGSKPAHVAAWFFIEIKILKYPKIARFIDCAENQTVLILGIWP